MLTFHSPTVPVPVRGYALAVVVTGSDRRVGDFVYVISFLHPDREPRAEILMQGVCPSFAEAMTEAAKVYEIVQDEIDNIALEV